MHGRMNGYLLAIALAALAIALPAKAELTAGRDFEPIIPAQVSDNPARIEVLEFFSYGCPHCSDFHPTISKWAESLPSDVVFKRVPISFARPQWASLARLYYALQATGELGKLDAAVFRALHQDGKKLYDDQAIIAWVSAQGVDSKKFTAAYNSFGVISQAKRGDQLAQAYKIKGVPALAVDGKYLVTGKDIKGFPELLALTDQIIDKARGEQRTK